MEELTKYVVAAAIVIVILILIFANIRVVPQAYAVVVERLGKYRKTWQAGIHVKVPFIEKIVNKVSLKEQVWDFPPQAVITKDNVSINVDSVVFAVVFDAKLYTYGVENALNGMHNLTVTSLRSIIGEMELDQTLTSREEINAKMLTILDEATDPWGIKIQRVTIKGIEPSPDIQKTMELQMKAERERRQTVLEAQAHKEAVVSRAEGDKQAKILAAEAERDAQIALAEGRAKSIKLVYDAEAEGLKMLSRANPSEQVIKLKGLEALKSVADGRATKIYMPSDITNTVAHLGVAGEALGIGDATEIDKSPKPEPEFEVDPCIRESTGQGGVDAYLTTEAIKNDVETNRFPV